MSGRFAAQDVSAEIRERAVLVGADRGRHDWPLDESLAELERLADTAGIDVVGVATQRLEKPNPRTFIGSGKAQEIVGLVRHWARAVFTMSMAWSIAESAPVAPDTAVPDASRSAALPAKPRPSSDRPARNSGAIALSAGPRPSDGRRDPAPVDPPPPPAAHGGGAAQSRGGLRRIGSSKGGGAGWSPWPERRGCAPSSARPGKLTPSSSSGASSAGSARREVAAALAAADWAVCASPRACAASRLAQS